MQTHILEASVEFAHQPFRKPLHLSSGLITEITQATASVTVRVGHKSATGRGSIYLSDLWGWPEPALSHERRDAALRQFCAHLASDMGDLCGEAAHPLEMGLHLHECLPHRSGRVSHAGRDYEIPLLARAMCASPFDAALHDAVGQALRLSAFDFYHEPLAVPSADKFFRDGATQAINRVLQTPRAALDAWLVVGASDDLEKDVAPWARVRHYQCFKLKILGKDNAADIARTIEVFRAVRDFGISSPRLSLDSNEANPNAAEVLDFLERLQKADAETYAALEYLEQPTGRDIARYAYDWHEVTALKPVYLDEGLTSLELMEVAVKQGWSGFALKTCKGHSFTLVAAAWAHENGLRLCVQDLTNAGLCAIHAAMLASHLPTVNGIELNSPQYTPSANAPWLPRLNELLDPYNGKHSIESQGVWGLGSCL